MKGSYLWKGMYLACALLGMLTGYGLFAVQNNKEAEINHLTEDNTLNRFAEDSVFFDEKEKERDNSQTKSESVLDKTDAEKPDVMMENKKVGKREEEAVFQNDNLEPQIVSNVSEPEAEQANQGTVSKMDSSQEANVNQGTERNASEPEIESVSANHETVREIAEPELESVNTNQETVLEMAEPKIESASANQETVREMAEPEIGSASANQETVPEMVEQETLTYPAEIFGQVPVINRTDDYVSYFEFSYDLVSMIEPMVKERGWNLNTLLAKFVVKALFCGIDVEKLDINEPIPRRLAALCLWLAAQVLGEEGCNTTAKSAQKYVSDLENCSRAEKKAVAYLYEQGIVAGYQKKWQNFLPEQGLKTETGTMWLSNVKQIWK